jgi:hypothetical protein
LKACPPLYERLVAGGTREYDKAADRRGHHNGTSYCRCDIGARISDAPAAQIRPVALHHIPRGGAH